jgi:hypothetical protein
MPQTGNAIVSFSYILKHFLTFLERKEERPVDLVFVFGATEPTAPIRFEKEKEIAKEMIDNEKEKDILYGIIVYGNGASVESKFKDMPERTKVKTFIDTLSWEDDGDKLDQALEETDDLFKKHGRPKARKITVVFVTGRADATTSELKRAAKKLNDKEVKVIVVKLGTDPDDKQLEVITPKKNIVKVKEGDDPKKSAELVDDERMKGNRHIDFSKVFTVGTYDWKKYFALPILEFTF